MAKYKQPTINTKFHLDFNWWQKSNKKFRAELLNHLCQGVNALMHEDNQGDLIDWVNPNTGEVFKIDPLWHTIRKQCVHDDEFITEYTPIATAVFRAFMVNNNTPLTPLELYNIIQKQSPEIILQTVGGRVIHQGIRPVN